MFRGAWVFITILLLLLSILTRQVPLLVVALLVFFANGVAQIWGHYCLDRVDYYRKLSSNRVFFGEEVQLEIEVANRKPLPLPWIQIDDEMPEEVSFTRGKILESAKVTRVLLNNFLPLSWYHRVKRRYHIKCQQRGYFALGPANLQSGDIFGFVRKSRETTDVDYLMVYPKMVPLEQLGIPSKQPFGDIRLKSHMFQDPVITAGVRDYHFGDSLKRVHWKSSARLRRLQTKVYEPTTTLDLGIFLDVRTVMPPDWGTVKQLLETAIIAAASFSKHALDEGYRVGLYVNQHHWYSDQLVKIPPSQHSDQLTRILESLSQVHAFDAMPISRFVQQEGRNLHWQSTLAVITAAPTGELLSVLHKARNAGRRVTLIVVGNAEVGPAGGLTVYHVPANAVWQDIEAMALVKT